MRNINLVFVDDELTGSVRVQVIKNKYDNEFIETHCFDESEAGLDFILSSDKPTILVLDLKMRDTELQGIEILKKIRETKKKISVIIKSGNNEITNEDFRELINNDISFFIKKASLGNRRDEEREEKESINNAIKSIMKNVSMALEEYVNRRKDKDQIMIISKSGNKISLSEMLTHVNNESDIGIDFEKSIYKLSIELLQEKK